MSNTVSKINKMIDFIKQKVSEGHTLQQITKMTYEARMRGEDMIYFGWGTKSKDKSKSYILPKPIAKQDEYCDFFDKPAEGCRSLPANSLYIYEDGRIEFFNKVRNTDGTFTKTDLYAAI